MKVLGFVSPDMIERMTNQLRALKIDPTNSSVPDMLEIAYVPERDVPGQCGKSKIKIMIV